MNSMHNTTLTKHKYIKENETCDNLDFFTRLTLQNISGEHKGGVWLEWTSPQLQGGTEEKEDDEDDDEEDEKEDRVMDINAIPYILFFIYV